MSLLDPLFRDEAIDAFFSGRATIGGLLAFEAALARAEARVGVIPAPAAVVIAAHCDVAGFDPEALGRAAAAAGNLAIPLVRALTARVAAADLEAARFVHWGATSQDAIDTGLVLQLRGALACVEAGLVRLEDALASLADSHRATPLAGRTWMQHAVPTTFGLKAAGGLDAVLRHRARVAAVRERGLVLQFGGAAGTLAALGERGLDVAAALAEELKLPQPDLPWHAHRDRVVEVATVLGLVAGTLGKMARDVALHAQTEVGELGEPTAVGRGGSTSMPHKRNPVSSAVVLAAATRVPGLVATVLSGMVQEDERGLGGWQAEWETVPEIVRLVGGALAHLTRTLEGLRVDGARMATNVDASRGLLFAEALEMALARLTNRSEARRFVEAACRRAEAQGIHLREAITMDPDARALLPADALARAFEVRTCLGVAERLVDRVLATHRAAGAPGGKEA